MEAYILFLIGAVFVVLGAIQWQKANHLLSNGRKAKAVIFTYNKKDGIGGNGMYYPVVRFLTDKEEWITQELSNGYTFKKKDGTKLDVIYDPEDPTNVEIHSTFQLEILPRLFVALGVGGIVFASLVLLEVISLSGSGS